MATVMSWTRMSRAKAIRLRLSATESSRSIAPRAEELDTVSSICAISGRRAKPPGSTATRTETALIWPRATWLAPSIGNTPKSTFLPPPAMTAPRWKYVWCLGLSTTVPLRPEASRARRIASLAASRMRSGSPLPMKRAHARAAASVARTSSSESSPRASEEGMAPRCCSMDPRLGSIGLFQELGGAQFHLVDAALQERGADEVPEQRVRPVRPGAELGVELARHEPRVLRQLDDLDQSPVGRHAAEDHPVLVHHLAVLVVELEAMAVALVDDFLAISLERARARQQLARVKAEPHRAAHLVDVALLGHQVDDRRGGERRELRRVGVGSIQLLAREVDDGALHAEAQSQVRDEVVPRVPGCDHLALDPAVAEAAWHDDSGHPHQRGRVSGVQLLRRHPADVDVEAVMDPGVLQRFDDAQVCVRQGDVLADDGDGHRGLGVLDPVDEL